MDHHGHSKKSRRRFLGDLARTAGAAGLVGGGFAGCDPSTFAEYAFEKESEKVADRFNESISGHAKPLIFPTASSDTFSFLWASDIHIAAGKGHHMDRLGAYAAQVGAVFLLHSGDCADDGTAEDYEKWVNVMHDYVPVPVFTALGNHDVYNGGWDRFKKRIGPSSYRFSYGQCDFVFVDTANGTLGRDQMDWFEKMMGRPNGATHRFVLSHYPIYDGGLQTPASMGNTEERMKMVALMDDGDVHYFLCGHKHSWEPYNIRGINHLISGCGSAYKQILNDDYHFHRFDVAGAGVSRHKIFFSDVVM